MLAEFVNAIAAQAQAALTKKPELMKLPGDRFTIVDANGAMGPAQDNPAPPHKQSFFNASELATFLKDKHGSAVVFITDTGIKAVYDLDTRRDTASVTLEPNGQFKDVEERDGTQMRQADFIRFLRINLAGCLPAGGGLIGLLRKVSFKVGQEGEAAVNHGSHSLSKNIMAQVAGIEAIPEELVLALPVFEGYAIRRPVRCAIEVFPDTQTFALTPYPGELDTAVQSALDEIRDTISAIIEHDQIYLGQP